MPSKLVKTKQKPPNGKKRVNTQALKSAPQGHFFQKSPRGRTNHTIKIIKNNAYILISSQKITKNKPVKKFSAQKLIHPLAIPSTAHQKSPKFNQNFAKARQKPIIQAKKGKPKRACPSVFDLIDDYFCQYRAPCSLIFN